MTATDWPCKHGPARYCLADGKFPAVITSVRNRHFVDIAYVYGGSVIDVSDVLVVRDGETGAVSRYVKHPAPDENVDVDAILLARAQASRLIGGDDANDAPTQDNQDDPA